MRNQPEVTEALLARFVEESHMRATARHSPAAVAGRIAGLLKARLGIYGRLAI